MLMMPKPNGSEMCAMVVHFFLEEDEEDFHCGEEHIIPQIMLLKPVSILIYIVQKQGSKNTAELDDRCQHSGYIFWLHHAYV